MPCPVHGERNISEFVCRGPVLAMPKTTLGTTISAGQAAKKASQLAWARYLFLPENKAGIVDEWWLHTPSGLWFVARRNTVSDEILQTWTIEAYRQEKAKEKAKPKVKR